MSTWSWIAVVAVAVLADLLLMRYLAHKLERHPLSSASVRLFGAYSPTLTWLNRVLSKSRLAGFPGSAALPSLSARLASLRAVTRKLEVSTPVILTATEILVLTLWAFIVTKPYLNLDPNVIPTGGEYSSAIQTHHFWTRLRECGLCAMWNGSTRGGAPYLVDVHGSLIHPLVAVTTLTFGVQNGAKLALSGAFLIAGLAQWWLASLLGLRRLARMWSSMMAVAGGHLAGHMELGVFGVVLSLAMCALMLPALVYLIRSQTRKSAVILGVCLALVLLAGQGYIQIGMFLSFLPAAVFLLPSTNRGQLKKLFARLLLAGLIAFLLAAPFLVPFLHFMPNFTKDLDPEFRVAQPLEYLPLNLVIHDWDYYHNESLQKLPYPSLYSNYIGWLAVGLAVCAVFLRLDRERRKMANFLLAAALLALFVASAVPLKWIIQINPIPKIDDFIAGVRHPPQIATLAGVALIALAGLGLDQVLKLDWPRFQISLVQNSGAGRPFTLDPRWLMLLPLAGALWSVYSYGRYWIAVFELDPMLVKINQGLRTPTLEWVNPPFGVHSFIESAVGMGLKLSDGIRTWNWADRYFPEPLLEVAFEGPPEGMRPYNMVGDVMIYQGPSDREYAQVLYSDSRAPTGCRASGNSGDIDVVCETSQPGTLVVKEYNWSGWHARLDGRPARLERGDWLSVALPAGEHRLEFRYRPWDVPLGVALWAVGLVLVAVLLIKPEKPPETSGEASQPGDLPPEAPPDL